MKKIYYQIGFLTGVRSRKMSPLTENKFYEIMNSKDTKAKVKKIRELVKQKETLAKGSDGYKDLDKQITKLKSELYAFLPMCLMPVDGKRPTKLEALPSGFCMHDFDDLKEDVRSFYINKVEPLKDELQIVMVYITPKGNGIRIIDRLPKGMTPAQHQREVAERLGVKNDESVKDLVRLSFITTPQDLLFADFDKLLNPSITEEEQQEIIRLVDKEEGITRKPHTQNENLVSEPQSQNATPVQRESQNATPWYDKTSDQPLLYNGVIPYESIFQKIIQRTCKNATVVEGEREMMCFQIASRIVPLTNHNIPLTYQVVAPYFLSKGLPNDEIMGAVKSAVKKNTNTKPDALVQSILQELNAEYGQDEDIPTPPVPEDIPDFFKLITSFFPEYLKASVLMAILPILGFLATGVRFRYIDMMVHSLSFISTVIAPSASCKGFAQYLYNLLTGEMRKQEMKLFRQEEEDRLKRRENEKVARKQSFKRYNFRFLAQDSTIAAIYKRIGEGDEKHKFIFTEEVRDLKSGNSYEQIRKIFLHAFDNSEISKETASDCSANVRANVYINGLMCGTNQEMSKFFGSGEDGLATRCCMITLPDNLDKDAPTYNSPTSEERQYIDSVVNALMTEGNGYEDNTVEYAFPLLIMAIRKSLKKQMVEYKTTDDKTWRKLGIRAHVIGYRAAVLAWLVMGKPEGMDSVDLDNVSAEIQKILNFMYWVIEYVQTTQYYVIGDKMQEAINQNAFNTTKKRSTTSMLDYLPEVFSVRDVNPARVRMGKSCHSNPSKLLSDLVKYGAIVREEEVGMYRKVAS